MLLEIADIVRAQVCAGSKSWCLFPRGSCAHGWPTVRLLSIACECEVDGNIFPPGLGYNKKEAKHAAACIAMDAIIEQGPSV